MTTAERIIEQFKKQLRLQIDSRYEALSSSDNDIYKIFLQDEIDKWKAVERIFLEIEFNCLNE